MTSIATRRIEPDDRYPGMLAYDLGEGREIVVLGSDDEAEEALRQAVERRLGDGG